MTDLDKLLVPFLDVIARIGFFDKQTLDAFEAWIKDQIQKVHPNDPDRILLSGFLTALRKYRKVNYV